MPRSLDLTAVLKSTFGFDPEDSIRDGRCVPKPIGCGQLCAGFRDERSRVEYTISGLCQSCQDTVFQGADTAE